VEPWVTVAIVVTVLAVLVIAAWDTTRALFVGGRAIREAKAQREREQAKAERLHRLAHPDEDVERQ
jgi:hypothetical protein